MICFFFFFQKTPFLIKGNCQNSTKTTKPRFATTKTWKKQEITRGFRVSEVKIIVTWAHWYRYIDQ